MDAAFDYLSQIVDGESTPQQRVIALRGFAEQLGWTPSYEIVDCPGILGVRDHLIVEHGIENAIAFSFLRTPRRPSDLDTEQLRRLLSISYNNLVEWHLLIARSEALFLNNLSDTSVVRSYTVSRSDIFRFFIQRFLLDEVRDAKLRRSIPPCDDAIVATISRWRRILKAGWGNQATSESLSELFNALIFARACEDYAFYTEATPANPRWLLTELEGVGDSVKFGDVLKAVFKRANTGAIDRIIDLEAIQKLPPLDKESTLSLCADLYRASTAPYDFDFFMMSKHALSKVYEKYVSLLKTEATEDQAFYFASATPIEVTQSKLGYVYTPGDSGLLRPISTRQPYLSEIYVRDGTGSGLWVRNLPSHYP